MTVHPTIRPSRRAFLAGAAGLVIGVYLPFSGRARAATVNALQADAAGASGQFAPNAFVRIAPDDMVTVLSKHVELGQGPYSGLAAIVAEELDADWSQMRAEAAPADVEKYANTAFGMQGTGGSTAIANSYEQLRMAGATARAMLVAAAAQQWGVPAAEITVEKGRVRHAGSGKESGFGALAAIAAALPPPADVALKDPKDFRLIGTDLPRLDAMQKSNGSAIFTLDVQLPDMVVALVAHPAHFGATVASFDDTAARAVKGVLDVRQVPQGVAVFARNTWAAIRGRDALAIKWDLSKAEARSSVQIIAEYSEAAKAPGLPVTNIGDIETAFAGVAPTLEADYTFPYLAHAPMEPLDAVLVKAAEGGIDVFMGSQMQTMDQEVVAATLGVPPETVRINTLFAGGSFGRRAQAGSPYAAEAAAAFKAFGASRAVKHMWTREDDIRGGFYRPIYVHRLKGWVQDGAIAGWDQTIVGQSIMAGTPFEAMMKDGVDPTSVEGASELPYSIPNHRVTVHNMKTGVPVLWWRSVGSTHTGFTTETFIDELLEAIGQDAVEGRLALLAGEPRHAGVLQRVAEMADWGAIPAEGRVRGVGLHKSFGTYVAQIAEISLSSDGAPRVHKVWCAVDCGVPITPNIIRAQMEGGIGYGLGAVLFNELTLGEQGRIVQSNFHDYRSIRINEMPDIAVDVIRSTEAPTGVGEPGVPPIGPAVANAWRMLTKEPLRQLPIRPLRAAS